MNSQDMINVLKNPSFVVRPKPLTIPTAALSDAPLLCLKVNAEWSSHLIGILETLLQPDSWLGTDDEIDQARQSVNEMIVQLMTNCEDFMYADQGELWHDQARILTGGALVRSSLGASPYNIPDSFYNTVSYQGSAANGDSFYQSFLCEAGEYEFKVLGAKNSSHGKLDWYLDDELTPFVSGQDWYNGGVLANQIQTASFDISVAGRHTMRGVVNGRNASNTLAYAIPLTKYWYYKTGD
jgi:hypothetical protein